MTLSDRTVDPLRTKIWRTVAATVLLLMGPGHTILARPDDYVKEIEEYRRDREARLRAPDGWLTLVGLFWLQPGANAFGSESGLPIVLPNGPARAGSLVLEGETVRLEPATGVTMTVRGKDVTAERVLADDTEDDPDILRLGRLSLYVIRRGDRLGVRVKDPESPVRVGFEGLEYYPIDPAYRVRARFEPYPEPKAVDAATTAGVVERMYIPGRLVFSLAGGQRTLEPFVYHPGETSLFIVFRDETSGTETYGAGRFLYSTLEGDGTAVVDFNRAYNPPCAFTSFATCPLPPRSNRMNTEVRAGEKLYGAH